MFDNLVDVTEPICQSIDEFKAFMTIFDTSGVEAYVTANNPKFANRIIIQLKSYKKSMNLDDSYDPYKAAYNSMPSHASSNPRTPSSCRKMFYVYPEKDLCAYRGTDEWIKNYKIRSVVKNLLITLKKVFVYRNVELKMRKLSMLTYFLVGSPNLLVF